MDISAGVNGPRLVRDLCGSGKRNCSTCEEDRAKKTLRDLRRMQRYVSADEIRDSFSCTPEVLCKHPGQVVAKLKASIHWCHLPACDVEGADGAVSE